MLDFKLNALFNKIAQFTELSVLGSKVDLHRFSEKLLDIEDDFLISLSREPNEFYKGIVSLFEIQLLNDGIDLLQIELNDDQLKFLGTKKAFEKLAVSLLNVFENPTPKTHLHLEYSEGDQMLRPTDCTIVFIAYPMPSETK